MIKQFSRCFFYIVESGVAGQAGHLKNCLLQGLLIIQSVPNESEVDKLEKIL